MAAGLGAGDAGATWKGEVEAALDGGVEDEGSGGSTTAEGACDVVFEGGEPPGVEDEGSGGSTSAEGACEVVFEGGEPSVFEDEGSGGSTSADGACEVVFEGGETPGVEDEGSGGSTREEGACDEELEGGTPEGIDGRGCADSVESNTSACPGGEDGVFPWLLDPVLWGVPYMQLLRKSRCRPVAHITGASAAITITDPNAALFPPEIRTTKGAATANPMNAVLAPLYRSRISEAKKISAHKERHRGCQNRLKAMMAAKAAYLPTPVSRM